MKTIKKIIAFVILLSIAWYCSFSFYFAVNHLRSDFPNQLWWNIPTMIFGIFIAGVLFVATIGGITFSLTWLVFWSINQFKPIKRYQLPNNRARFFLHEDSEIRILNEKERFSTSY